MLQIQKAVLERINSLIVVINKVGLVDYVSPSVEKSLGFKKEELIGEGWWIKTRNNDIERTLVRKEVKEIIKLPPDGLSLSRERMLVNSAGQNKWILWNISKGPDDSIISIGYDITERKLAEEKLVQKNDELQKINSELIDSIEYAKNIQESILPNTEELKESFEDAFVYYAPKHIVSGDFYWIKAIENEIIFLVLDCTGHGVPGALMTMLANSLLKEVIVKRKIDNLDVALTMIDEELIYHTSGKSSKALNDGMDLALCKFNKDTKILNYAGAMRPLWIFREGKLIEYKGSRYPIGFYHGIQKQFINEEIQLKSGDSVYLFSDGFVDQFGGEKNKKFNKKRFEELLLSVQDLTMNEQESFLGYALNNWKQENEQTDDIVIMGIKI